MGCREKNASGRPCKATVLPGRDVCRWHDPSPEGRAAHQAISRKGGHAKAYNALPMTDSLAEDPRVGTLDLSTATGLRDYLAAALAALGRLPFDARTANSIGQLATAQRALLEASDTEARIAALEAAAHTGPRLTA